jgi:hypothetical protein
MSPQVIAAGPYRRDSRDDGPADSGSGTRRGTQRRPDVWTKAAALRQTIVSNDAPIDLNERLGWLATAVVLHVDVDAAAPDA